MPHLVLDNSVPGPVVVWDAATGKRVRELKGLRGYVWPYRPAFSRDGKLVAAACSTWGVQVWDATTGEPGVRLKGRERGEVAGLAFDPDGRRLFVAGSRGVEVWDLASGQELLTLRGTVTAMTLSPDGRHLAIGGKGEVRLYDAAPALTPATARRREVVARVRKWYDDGLLQSEVLAQIEMEKGDEAYRAVVREVARTSAENAAALREASWAVVRKPGRKETEYRTAIERAERAAQLDPTDARAKLAVGAGYYRAGEYQKAVKILERAYAIVGVSVPEAYAMQPIEVHAFLGLAMSRLGGAEASRSAAAPLGTYRGLLKRREESVAKIRKHPGAQVADYLARRLRLAEGQELLPEVEEALKKKEKE